MASLSFREICPQSTYTGKEYSDYRRYKGILASDFNSRCGYTNCYDFWFGGQNNFQIDHFKPKSKYPELETCYSNLVYTCSYVNRAKSDDDLDKYIDPVNEDYNTHFHRDELGNIYPIENSERAKYMYIKLKLYLKRYSIIWMLDQLEKRMYTLQELIEKTNNSEAKELFIQITMKYNDYKKYLRAVQ